MIQADLNVLADPHLAPFSQVRGTSTNMSIGDRHVIQVAGPWKGAVEVIDVTPCSFRLATLEGHMESGVIDIRIASNTHDDHSALELTIESWARSHDRIFHVIYDRLGVGEALQREMWSIAWTSSAKRSAGSMGRTYRRLRSPPCFPARS